MALLAGLLVLSIWLAPLAFAQDQSAGEGERESAQTSAANCSNVPYGEVLVAVDDKPPNSPTLVDVGLFVDEITEVTPIDSTFKIEGTLDLIWCDPREAFSAREAGVEPSFELEGAAQSRLDEIWSPDLTLVNEVNPRELEDQELIVYPDGTIEYREKFSAQLEANYDFKKFPFDRQTLVVELESFAWTAEDVVLHEEKGMAGVGDEFELPEWNNEDAHTSVTSVREVRDRAPFSEFLVEIDVVRESGFYIWKILLPLVLMVAASWSVFWMTYEGLSARVGLSFVGILTVVAYQFIMFDTVPKVSTITFWDGALTLSFLLMALTIPQNIVVRILDPQKEGTRKAVKLDRTCRWAFPLAYGLGLGALAIFFLL